jgi:hypothetical protein
MENCAGDEMNNERIEYEIDGDWVDGEQAIQRRERIVRIVSGVRPEEYAATMLVDLLHPDRCYRELLQRLHPDGLACSCGERDAIGHGRTRAGLQVNRCRACGTTYTILSGTPFNGTKLDAARIVLFMRLWAAGESAERIGREIGLHRNSVQMLITKLTMYGKYAAVAAE